MRLLNTKMVLAAAGLALLATPALAQHSHRPVHPPHYTSNTYGSQGVGTYPDGGVRTGTAWSRDTGALFDLQH